MSELIPERDPDILEVYTIASATLTVQLPFRV